MGLSEFEDGFEGGAERPSTELSEEQALGEAILSAHIRDLAPRPAVTVPETMSIGETIRLMLDHKIGAMLVLRDGKAIGIFTERDVLQRVAISGIDRDRPVADVMTKNPEVLSLDDGIAFALNRMIARGFRHIPIVDRAGSPVAVLSVREVVAHIVGLLPARVHNLPPEPGLGIAKTTDGG